MVIISADLLETFSQYKEHKLKVKIIHFCPLDGKDKNVKRIVVTCDVSQQQQQPIDRYLVIVFYGCYAKTPFKKSELKCGQIFTLLGFETSVMPKNKVFKSRGHILDNFYEPLVVVKPDFEPIIKMLVSLREETFVAIADNESADENPLDMINDNRNEDNINKNISQNQSNEAIVDRSHVKKRLRFGDNDNEQDIQLSTNDDLESGSDNALKNTTNTQKNRVNKRRKTSQSNEPIAESESTSAISGETNVQKQPKYEYKTLLDVHKLIPVSGTTYCHIYGVLRYRELTTRRNNTNNLESSPVNQNGNAIYLKDEKISTFTIDLKPGKSKNEYPSFRPGDIVRVHRMLLAPNTMHGICTDPKDVVVFEAFQNSESFSPIKTSVSPTFEDFDRQRKRQIDEWFADELLRNSLSGKTETNPFTDLVVQVIRVTTDRELRTLSVWDTTKPALKTLRSHVDTYDMNMSRSDTELVRIINENQMSIELRVYGHTEEVKDMKPFDYLVFFNVNVRPVKYDSNHFTYTLNSRYDYGKYVRVVKRDSCLGQKLSARIEEYKVMSAVNVEQVSIEDAYPSQSEIDVNDTLMETTPNRHEESAVLSGNDTDFDINFDEVIDICDREQQYMPSVHIVSIPERDILFSDLLTNSGNNQLYKVKARVMCYLPSREKRDVISVLCTNQECHRLMTLRQVIIEDPLIEPIVESSKDNKLRLNCFKCNESNCVLVFKIIFIMEDMKRNKLMAQLFGHNAEVFFGCTPEAVLQDERKWSSIENTLHFICSKETPIDSKSENVVKYWVIQPSKVADKDVFIYQIRTATDIEVAEKCIGVCLE